VIVTGLRATVLRANVVISSAKVFEDEGAVRLGVVRFCCYDGAGHVNPTCGSGSILRVGRCVARHWMWEEVKAKRKCCQLAK